MLASAICLCVPAGMAPQSDGRPGLAICMLSLIGRMRDARGWCVWRLHRIVRLYACLSITMYWRGRDQG